MAISNARIKALRVRNAVTGEGTESPSYKIHQESIYRVWGPQSRAAEGHPPPEPPTQAVLDPALFPLFDGCCLVGRLEHGNTATPADRRGW